MIRGDWPSQYWDLLDKMDPTLIEVWPNNEYQDASGQPASMDVRIKPKGLSLLQQRPREVHRQVTVDGKGIDLRNDRSRMIVTPPIENLIIMATVWMNRLKTERNIGPWRANRLTLDRLLAYRGHELPPMLKDQLISALEKYIEPKNNGYPNKNAEEVSECVGV